MSPIEYLDFKNTGLPERRQEQVEVESSIMRYYNFMSSLKQSLIQSAKKAPSTLKQMQSFFVNCIKTQQNSKENYR